MTVAVQAGWAPSGVLSGSREGATGATLLVLNMALSVPMLLASSDARAGRLSGMARAIGVASLLGLPPLGGFAGTLLVAQSVTNLNGIWLATLLLGTLMAAAAWFPMKSQDNTPPQKTANEADDSTAQSSVALGVITIGIALLLAAQLALLLASAPIGNALATWTDVPWLNTP